MEPETNTNINANMNTDTVTSTATNAIPEMKTPPQMPEENKSSTAMTVVSVIIVILLIAVGVFYFVYKDSSKMTDDSSLTSAEIQADPMVSSLQTQGTSTNLNDIQNDINATDINNIGAGLDNVAI